MKALYPLLAVTGGVLVLMRLPGHASPDEQALRDWVAGQRQHLSAIAATASAPQPAVPAGYRPSPKPDPFDARRLASGPVIHREPVPVRSEPSLEESLESYPFSSLRMVGSLRKEDAVVALIQAGARVHQVSVGARIGAGRAEVLQISETGVLVREGASGAGRERAAHTVTLQLQGR